MPAVGLLARLLPAGVAAVEVYADPPGLRLQPAEAHLLGRVAPARRREFATGRFCARAAMARLGLDPAAVGVGPSGAPVWPAGLVGSITHCAGYRAAAVARAAQAPALGIDAEPDEPLPTGVLDRVALPGERARAAGRPVGVAWDRLLFSAKEAVYKAWFPLTGAWLDFTDVDVEVDPATRRFTARLLVPGPVVGGVRWTGFDGAFVGGRPEHRGLLVTAVVGGGPDR